MTRTPFQQIQKELQPKIPEQVFGLLPKKWEKIGTILIMKLPELLEPFSERIGATYAKVLRCDAVLVDTGGITGKFRKPELRHIFGKKNTETVHDENGIRFHLDPQKIMYSSGNIDERKRMSMISHPFETVVDLFAGIGYFTIPLAVHSTPKKMFACEINPTAFLYLKKNILENNVSDIVVPLFGDSKSVAPKNVADRVIMGYFHETRAFLETALSSLKNQKGIIHYHDTFPDESIPYTPLHQVQEVCSPFNRHAHILFYRAIKSYAPGISHYVFDMEIKEERS